MAVTDRSTLYHHGLSAGAPDEIPGPNGRKFLASLPLPLDAELGNSSPWLRLTELGDVRRMSSSRKAVRFAGIDIGVHRSDQTARVRNLTRQGSPTLRLALYEAAQPAA